MKYKALIFDLDGTLLDTLKDISVAVNYALRINGYKERSDKEIESYLGNGSRVLITKAIGEEVSEEKFNKIFDDYFSYYLKNALIYTSLYKNIPELINYAKYQNMKLAIVTNKPNDLCLEILNHCFQNVFDKVYPQREGKKKKPDKEAINEALDGLNVKKEEALYIGDSIVDMEASINASVDYRLVRYGYGNVDSIKNVDTSKIVNTPLDIINVLSASA